MAIDRKNLFEMYIIDDMSKGEIAKEFKTTEGTIKQKLKKMGIKKNKPWKGRKKYFAKKKKKNSPCSWKNL